MVPSSGPLKLEVTTNCINQAFEIVWVRRNDEIVAAQRPFGDTRVDDIRCAGRGGQSADRTRSVIIEDLDVAATEELGKLGLASPSTPSLGNDRRWHGRDGAERKQCPVSSPHPALTSVGGDEGTGVVRHAHQAVRRDAVPVLRDRSTASAAHASASASSVSVNGPFARSNSATPSRPS